jgi:hypothetical protein
LGDWVFVAALVSWVVAFLGDRAVEGITRVVRGSPEYQALQDALTVAISSLLADAPEESREALENALRECFSAPPSVVKDGRTRVRTGIIRAIQVRLAPLADPAITPSEKSFFDEIDVDGALLRDEVPGIVIRSIEQVGPGHPALTPPLTPLNADALAEQVDAVLAEIPSLHALADAPARPDPRDGRWRVIRGCQPEGTSVASHA